MGSFPGNWDADARTGLKTRAQRAIVETRDYPYEPHAVSQMGVSVSFESNMVFPPTGLRGCWKITRFRPWNRETPQTFWRQNAEEAAELFRESISQNIYDGFAAPEATWEFVDALRIRGMVGF